MDKILYCEIIGICICVLGIVLYNDTKRIRGPVLIGQSIFHVLIWVSIGFGIVQAIYKGIGYEYSPLVAWLSLSLYYIFRSLIFCMFLLYIDYELYPNNKRFLRRLPLYFLPSVFLIVMILCNYRTGWIFVVSDNNYLRGPLFHIPRMIFIIYTLYMFYIIFKHQKNQDKNVKNSSYRRLLIFPCVPCISTILQILMPVSAWTVPVITMAILVNYIAVQNGYMARDHLTGLYNRSQLEGFMNYQIKNLIKGNFLFLIMLDLDKFKAINDTYGHVVGDDALIQAANLLRKSCKRKSDYVVRLGGDEFVLIGQCESKDAVKEIVERIHTATYNFNKTSNKVYQINFSAGYVIYDGSEETTLDKLISKADSKMYEDKKAKKRKNI